MKFKRLFLLAVAMLLTGSALAGEDLQNSEEQPDALVWQKAPLYRAGLSARGGTFYAFELLAEQYHQELDEEPDSQIPSWLNGGGPLQLVTTWDTRYLPFQFKFIGDNENLSGVIVKRKLKQPVASLAAEKGWKVGQEIEADFVTIYEIDPIFTLVSAPDDPEAVYVWPDPQRDTSTVFIERRMRPAEDYRTHLQITLYNFGDTPFSYTPSLNVTGWEHPNKKKSRGMFTPPPNILEGLCMAGDDLTRETGDDLVEEPENPEGEAAWAAVGNRYFIQAAIPRVMPRAACQLMASTNGTVRARLYQPRTELRGGGLAGCTPSWMKDDGSMACTVLAENLGLEPGQLTDRGAVEKALQEGGGDAPDVLRKELNERLMHHAKGTGRVSYEFEIYVGPKDISMLKNPDVGLEDTIDFWIVGIISKPMLHLLRWFHDLVPNWTLAIIFLTILVKLVLLPLTQKSFGQMQRMSSLKPQMDALKEKYGKDKSRLNQEIMNLYKREKVNPLGGCLPMLLQMPIWIALYRTIYSSVGLYQAPMGGWIKDLSAPDPYFVLPILLGALMFAQQKLTPTATDNQQAKVMLYIMPLMFTVFMLFLPSGLNLYILVNTLLSLVQQYYLRKKLGGSPRPATAS